MSGINEQLAKRAIRAINTYSSVRVRATTATHLALARWPENIVGTRTGRTRKRTLALSHGRRHGQRRGQGGRQRASLPGRVLKRRKTRSFANQHNSTSFRLLKRLLESFKAKVT